MTPSSFTIYIVYDVTMAKVWNNIIYCKMLSRVVQWTFEQRLIALGIILLSCVAFMSVILCMRSIGDPLTCQGSRAYTFSSYHLRNNNRHTTFCPGTGYISYTLHAMIDFGLVTGNCLCWSLSVDLCYSRMWQHRKTQTPSPSKPDLQLNDK